MNDALDDMPAPKVTTTQTAAVALPVPAPARPAGPQMAWSTGAQPVAADAAPAVSVPLPPIPDPSMRAASPVLAMVAPPLPPTRPVEAPVQVAMLDADQAPAAQAYAQVPAPPVRPQLPVLQPGKPVAAAVAGTGDLPRQFLQGAFQGAGGSIGQALGYAAPDVAVAAPVAQPKVEFVAVSFDQVDFGALASPVTAARDRAQTELYAPDLNAGSGMMRVAYRIGPQRLALHPMRTAGFAGATLASVN